MVVLVLKALVEMAILVSEFYGPLFVMFCLTFVMRLRKQSTCHPQGIEDLFFV